MADYVKMWEDLGMDINNHDNLCQVLPTAVGDVFMTQENRPKAMDFWDMVIAEVHGIRPAELIEEQKAEKERHHDADTLNEGEQRRREHPALVFARKL